MYRGFNLELNESSLNALLYPNGGSSNKLLLRNHIPPHVKKQNTPSVKFLEKNLKKAMLKKRLKDEYSSCNERFNGNLDRYIKADGSIDVSRILADWFPSIDAHVFISHSREDHNLATDLAEWLQAKFNIVSFIDSYVWGYVKDLLKEIDEKYSRNTDADSYDYELRNHTTANAYMMLAASLVKMIDETEIVIFVNTKNSVIQGKKNPQTHSNWLYYETLITNLIRQTNRKRTGIVKEGTEMTKSLQKQGPKFSYDVDLKNLEKLDLGILQQWNNSGCNSPEDALDWLYGYFDSKIGKSGFLYK